MQPAVIKVDILIIGSVKASSYASCYEGDALLCATENVVIGKDEFPKEIRTNDAIYDVSEAVFIRTAGDGPLTIESILVPKGKRLLAIGSITANDKSQ